MKKNQYVIAVYVENKPGVLTRVAGMFHRRGFNIDSLTVGETETPAYSRITLTLTGESGIEVQMLNQLRKLYNVRKVELLDPDDSISRELLLIKMQNIRSERQDILTAVDVYRGKIIELSGEAISIELTGSPNKIDAFIGLMKDYHIIEMCRTGIVALERGSGSILNKEI